MKKPDRAFNGTLLLKQPHERNGIIALVYMQSMLEKGGSGLLRHQMKYIEENFFNGKSMHSLPLEDVFRLAKSLKRRRLEAA